MGTVAAHTRAIDGRGARPRRAGGRLAAEGCPERHVLGGAALAQFSEEWYWEQLVDNKPFRSVYEEQPLISKRSKNLSQTPREKCELEGRVREGLERDGPGQVGA